MAVGRALRLVAALAFGLGLLIGDVWTARGQTDDSDLERLVRALGITTGQTVAEIGAGRGQLTLGASKAVGPSGRVFSNEIDPRRRDDITRAAGAAGLTNVTVVEGRAADTNLPPGCCDVLFMRDVFHHFEDRDAMSRSLWASLRPGGRLGVLDFPPRGSHGITEAGVRSTLERAGFVDVRIDASGARWYLVVATKPDGTD